ncbi:hypothetical protein HZS_504 [Henneguya salminicola]|nr:hypothetical protein HZS_504 [Henneguya salminicola]
MEGVISWQDINLHLEKGLADYNNLIESKANQIINQQKDFEDKLTSLQKELKKLEAAQEEIIIYNTLTERLNKILQRASDCNRHILRIKVQ